MTVYIVQSIFSTASKIHEDVDMVFDNEGDAWHRIEKLYYDFINVISALKDTYNAEIVKVRIKDSGVMIIFGFNNKKRYVLYRIVKRIVNE